MADVTSSAPVSTPATPDAGPAAQAQPTKAEVARMMKLKVDGQEMDLPESEVIKLAQLGKSADKRFQEAALSRRQAEDIIKFAQENPVEFFKKTGKNARQWAEDFLLGEIRREQMSPEQKKAYENEQRLKQYEAQEKAAKDKAHNDRMQALEREQMQNYDQMFVKALTDSGLPKTPYTVKRMAELTLVNVKKGLNLEPAQLAKIVREDYQNEMKALYGQADGDALLELLGKDAVKKLSKAQLAKYKSGKNLGSPAPRGLGKSKDEPLNPIDAWKQMKKKTRSLI